MDKLRLDIILKQLLKERNLSMREVGKLTGIPEATLSGYANGAEPSKMQHIRALARFFGIGMEELLYGDSGPPSLQNVDTEELFSGWVRIKIEKAIPHRRKTDGKQRDLD